MQEALNVPNIALVFCSTLALGCGNESGSPTSSPAPPDTVQTNVVLNDGRELQGTERLRLEILEGATREEDKAQLSFDAQDESGLVAVRSQLSAEKLLEGEWTAKVATRWVPGGNPTANVTLHKGEGEELEVIAIASEGEVTFTHRGDLLEGEANVSPDTLDLHFSTQWQVDCLVLETVDPSLGEEPGWEDDYDFASEFCQRFAALRSN